MNPSLTLCGPETHIKTGTLANRQDPDEMLHNVAFHQGLHCLLRQKNEMQHLLEILYPVTPQYIQWTILTLLFVSLWKIPLV